VKRLKPWIGTLAVTAIAVPLICIGIFIATLLPWALDSASAEVEQLQPISAVVFEDSSPGRRALIEGRLSRANPVGPDGFVAYTRFALEPDGEGGTRRRELEQSTPELIVTLTEGEVLVGGDYDLRGIASEAQQTDEVIEGLRPGDPILAIGTISLNTDGEPILIARWVNPTTRAEYLQTNNVGGRVLRIFGWGFAGVGLVLLGLGGGLAALNLRRRHQSKGATHG
jgi:hypothetical protein